MTIQFNREWTQMNANKDMRFQEIYCAGTESSNGESQTHEQRLRPARRFVSIGVPSRFLTASLRLSGSHAATAPRG